MSAVAMAGQLVVDTLPMVSGLVHGGPVQALASTFGQVGADVAHALGTVGTDAVHGLAATGSTVGTDAAHALATTEPQSWWETLIEWFKNPEALLLALGRWVLAGVALIVFIESGVLFPVLPGDSLVFSAGLLHTQLGLSLWVLVVTITACALAGSEVGYWLGKQFGRRLFSPDAKVLKTEYLVQAENFFARYGGRSLVIGRFVPFVRTFVPIAAGIAGYNHARFLLWNLVGALLWGTGLTLLGAALGGVSFIHDNLTAIILVIVAVSLLPMVVEFILHKRRQARGQ